MADTMEKVVVLKVGTDQAARSIKDLETNISVLKKELKGLVVGSEEYGKTLSLLEKNQKALKSALDINTQGFKTNKDSFDRLSEGLKVFKDAWAAASSDVQRSKLADLIRQVTDRMNAMKAELNETVKGTKAVAGSYAELQKKYNELYNTWKTKDVLGSKEWEEHGRQLMSYKKRMIEIDATVGNHQRKVGSYAEAIKSSFNSIFPSLNMFKKGIGVALAVAPIIAFGKAIKAAFRKLKQLTVEAVKGMIEYEQSVANLATIMGKSRKEMSAINTSALVLGRTTEWTAAQVVKLQTELAKLGFGASQIQNMQRPILQFSTAVGAGLSEASEFVGAQLRAFGLFSNETQHVADVLTAAVNRSSLSFEKLKVAMQYVAPAAKAMGLSIEDSAAMIGALSNAGFSAERAGVGARKVLIELVKDGSKLQQLLGGKTIRSFKDVVDALELLKKKGYDVSDMFKAGGDRAGSALAAYSNAVNQMIDLRGKLDNVDGESARIQKERLKTVQGSITLLKSAWESFTLSFQESTGPMAKVFDWIRDRINEINDKLFPEHKIQETAADYATWFEHAYSTAAKAGKDFAEMTKLGREAAEKDIKKQGEDIERRIYAAMSPEDAEMYLRNIKDIERTLSRTDLSAKEREHFESLLLAQSSSRFSKIVDEATRVALQKEKAAYDSGIKIYREWVKNEEHELQQALSETLVANVEHEDEKEAVKRRKKLYDDRLDTISRYYKLYTEELKAANISDETRITLQEQLDKDYNEGKVKILSEWLKEVQTGSDEELEVTKKLKDAETEIVIAGYNAQAKAREKAAKGAKAELRESLKNAQQLATSKKKAVEQEYSDISANRNVSPRNPFRREGLSFDQQKEKVSRLSVIDIEKINAEAEAYKAVLDRLQEYDDNYAEYKELYVAKIQEAETRRSETQTELFELELEQTKQEVELMQDMADKIASIFATIADIYQDDIEARVEAGEISAEQGEKEFENVKALQTAEAVINTIAGAVGAFTGITASTGGWGIAAAIATATSVLIAGFAQVKKIQETQLNGSAKTSTSIGASVAPPAIIQQVPVTRSLTGASEEERLNQMMRDQRVVLVYDDVQKAGKYVQTVQSESEF